MATWMTLYVHDHVSGEHLVIATAVIALLAVVGFLWRRPRVTRVVLFVLAGGVVTALTAFVASTDHSGDWQRTRHGLPHVFAIRNVDPATAAAVTPFRVIPQYLLGDLAFWCALGGLTATLTTRRPSARLG